MHLGLVEQLRWWLSSALPSLAVATFFIIAGFLFFQGYTPQQGLRFFLRKWHKRLRTLLLPYLLWNLLKFLQLWGKHGWDSFASHWRRVEGFNFLWGEHTIGRPDGGFWGLPLGSFDAPLNVPLWFVRELMIFLLLSPLLLPLLRRKWLALGVLLLLFALYGLYALPYPLGISLRSLPMFALGAAVALQQGDLYAPLRRWRWSILTTYVVLLLLQWSGHSSQVLLLLSTATGIGSYFVLAGSAVEVCGPPSRRLSSLAAGSFLIYAAHTVGVLGSSIWLVKHYLPGTSLLHQSLHYLLPPLLCTAVLLLTFVLLRRFLPRWSAPLTGVWER